jgi:hypothetical protein
MADYCSSFGGARAWDCATPVSRLKVVPASRNFVKSSPQILFLKQMVDVDLKKIGD